MPRQRVAPSLKRMALAHKKGASTAKPKNSRPAASCWPVSSAIW